MGADFVINHNEELVPQLKKIPGCDGPSGCIDLIFCTVNADLTFNQWPAILKPKGRSVFITADPLPNFTWNVGSLTSKCLQVSGELMFSKTIHNFELDSQGEILEKMRVLLENNSIVSTKMVEYDWKDILQATEKQESGSMMGKITLRVIS